MFLFLGIIRISQAQTSTPTLLLGHTLTHPEQKTLTQQLQEQRTESSSRPELSNRQLIIINYFVFQWLQKWPIQLDTQLKQQSPEWLLQLSPILLCLMCQQNAFQWLTAEFLPGIFIFYKACICVWFLTGFPFSLLHLHYGTVSAAPDPLHKNYISLLTQCSDPMQTLAARRGTVGSVGRSLAHSLSTDTAYADWRRRRGREEEEIKKAD